MGKRGRKSTFNQKIADTISRLISEGKTEDEVAEIIGVSRTTLQNWKGKHPDFLYAVREARQVADELVEAALFSRATGYQHPAEKIMVSKELGVVREPYTEHYPPDTTAAMFWLRNRQPKKWKEKTEGDVNVKVQAGTMTDEELDAKIAEKLEKAGKK